MRYPLRSNEPIATWSPSAGDPTGPSRVRIDKEDTKIPIIASGLDSGSIMHNRPVTQRSKHRGHSEANCNGAGA